MTNTKPAQSSFERPEALLDYVVHTTQAQLASKQDWAKTRPYNWQCIRALAYLYAGPDNPLHGSLAVAEGIRELYQAIDQSPEPPDNRLTGHLAETHDLLTQAGLGDLVPGIQNQIRRGAEPLAEKLRTYRHLTHFTSANLGTGTNHVAVYACSVYRAGQILGHDEYLDLATSSMDRMAMDRTADGYWAETTGGPTGLYNNLTTCCFGRMARWTGNDDYRDAALKGARFHRRFSYPDGCEIETFDGRVRYTPVPLVWGLFIQSETPEGRAFAARRLQTLFDRNPPGTLGTHGGEIIALLCENHALWKPGPVGQAECERRHYVERLLVPGGVRRHGPWCLSMQGITHLPRGTGGFTIDRSGLISLWHERTGLIINGSGEPEMNPGQTFRFESSLSHEKHAYATPEMFSLSLGKPESDDPVQCTAEYRGGTGRIVAHFVSDTEIRLDVSAGARTDVYPVPFTLQLELRKGDRVNGTQITDKAIDLSGDDLGGKVSTQKFEITFPGEGATLRFPHDPYNPYDTTHHKSPADKYVTLLTLPISPEGAKIIVRVP